MNRFYLPKKNIAKNRVRLLSIWLFLIFATILAAGYGRLLMQGEQLGKRFFQTHHASRIEPAHRGSIFARDGGAAHAVALAMSSDTYHIALLPRLLDRANSSPQQYRRQAEALARALGMEADAVLEKMHTEKNYLYLKKNVPAAIAEHVKALSIAGVEMEYNSKRFYPDGMNFAHVIGFTNDKKEGMAGIEHAAHERLHATNGQINYIKAGGRGAVAELGYQPVVPGNNVYLTLERRLQYVAFNALAQAVQHHKAASAAALVMDVGNGDIVALANYPSYNPNYIRKEDLPNQINHALADQVEPGSTVKPFVAALALENQLTHMEEVFRTTRALQIGKLRVYDKHVREDLDLSGVIRKSSNIGAVLLAQRAGAPALESFYHRLGFGGGKVLGLRGEAGGKLRPSSNWRREDFATHAYGYGFSLTLPQLARAYSIFATDGLLVSPRLWQSTPVAAKKRVLSARTARHMRGMLEQVTSTEGTGARAAIAGYRVAGKTGTVGKWTNGKLDLTRRRTFFVGFAPVSQPRYIVAVMVDEPTRRGDTGGSVAAPVFRQIMKNALLFGGIRPDAVSMQET